MRRDRNITHPVMGARCFVKIRKNLPKRQGRGAAQSGGNSDWWL